MLALPEQFAEYYLRVFIRNEKKLSAAKLAFERYIKKFFS
jgi:hypothetical protein